MTIQLLCVGVFYLLIFGTGIYAGLRRDRSQADESAGFLLANRKLPLWIGAITMTATWVGGGYINGTAEVVYNSTAGLVWAQAPWGYALSLILGGLFFARRMRRENYSTMLDPFEQRYGKRVSAVLFVPALIGEVFWSAAVLVALGMTFSVILDVNLATAIIVSASIAVCYTMVGGLWSVAYTDVAQLACIVLGLGLAVPFVVSTAGGAEFVATAYFEQTPSFPTGNGVWLWLDMALLLICGGIPWQVYFQRVLAMPDEASAVRLSWMAGLGCLLLAIPPVIIGAAGAVADWPALGAEPPANAAMILPEVLLHMTPSVVGTLGLAAVAAAVMSSVDSSILSASSMFVWNIYRPMSRTQPSSRSMSIALRLTTLVIGSAATWLALSVQSVYALWYLCADLVYVILFPQLVMVLFSRTTNATGAMIGAAVGLVLRLGGGEAMLGIPSFIDYPLATPAGSEFPFRTFAMLASLFAIWAVSKLSDGFRISSTGGSEVRQTH